MILRAVRLRRLGEVYAVRTFAIALDMAVFLHPASEQSGAIIAHVSCGRVAVPALCRREKADGCW